jgi:predicted Zn-ribbon and HTH transcriptional regulator
MLKEGIKTRTTSWRKEYKQEVHAEGRNKNKKYKLKEGIQTRSIHRKNVFLVFNPSFCVYFLFVFLPSACTSCFYSFLQHVLLVFIPSFSMYFLLLFLPSACTSCFYSFLQHEQEVQAEGRNKNKKFTEKDGLKTRSTCWRKVIFISSFSMYFLFLTLLLCILLIFISSFSL